MRYSCASVNSSAMPAQQGPADIARHVIEKHFKPPFPMAASWHPRGLLLLLILLFLLFLLLLLLYGVL